LRGDFQLVEIRVEPAKNNNFNFLSFVLYIFSSLFSRFLSFSFHFFLISFLSNFLSFSFSFFLILFLSHFLSFLSHFFLIFFLSFFLYPLNFLSFFISCLFSALLSSLTHYSTQIICKNLETANFLFLPDIGNFPAAIKGSAASEVQPVPLLRPSRHMCKLRVFCFSQCPYLDCRWRRYYLVDDGVCENCEECKEPCEKRERCPSVYQRLVVAST